MTRRSLLLGFSGMQAATPVFEEIPSHRSGIRWVHRNAMSPERYLPETMGPGVAFLDYDNDGWMDIFLVNSGPSDFYQPHGRVRHALYRNQRNGTFREVTDTAGVGGGLSFGMGVAAADYNNDGFPDLFVTAYGRATLYRNNGDGTFRDVTEQAGLAIPGWTTSALWFDYDGDGLLDLFVCNFIEYRKETQAICISARGGKPGYCIPRMFRPTGSYLFKNNGDGTFRDVSRETHIASRMGKALGAVATDIDNNGLADLFVANDTVENFLFANRGAKGFEDIGMGALVALSTDGLPRSGMGVDAADINNDGRQDLFVANIDKERFSLYRNTGYGMFDDLSFAGEIGRATYYLSGWGLKFFDFDNDGVTDLLVANGHPDDMVNERTPQVRYREPLLLFQQRAGEFRNISAQAGPAFQRDYSARGLAVGDFDNDGFVDALVGVNGAEPLLLRNTGVSRHHWIGVKLRGVKSNRDGVGALISWRSNGLTRSRYRTAGGSYLSSHDPREVLGLGTAARADWVQVKWPLPSRRVERFSGLTAGRYHTLTEGEGDAVR